MAGGIPKTEWGPGFSKLYIDKFCGRQTSEDRFGPGARKEILLRLKMQAMPGVPEQEFEASDNEDTDDGDSGWDDGDDDAQDGSEQAAGSGGHLAWTELSDPSETSSFESAPPRGRRYIPHIARNRINLTALSQQYDLYFVAYQHEIYIYQPQQALQILGNPLLVLRPKESTVAYKVGGHIDKHFHHQVNHVIVGDLGDKEVLLFAYDDGDVVAYYTSVIATCCARKHERPSYRTAPQPFFCETVGNSAWGLAIHRQSRLIAVSSNLHEVTVFAFALERKRSKRPVRDSSDRLGACVSSAESSDRPSQALCILEPRELETHLRSRERTWRIILPAGLTGHNIASVSFIDDEDGEAERIAAQDILGNCWLFDIWRVGSTTVRLPAPAHEGRHTGWGVLVLPLSSFLLTQYGSHCLGADPRACPRLQRENYVKFIDATPSLLNIDDNASHHVTYERLEIIYSRMGIAFHDPKPRIAEEMELSECEETDQEDVAPSDDSYARWNAVKIRNKQSDIHKASINLDLEARYGYRQELIAVPNLGYSYRADDQTQLLKIHERSPQRKAQAISFKLDEAVSSLNPYMVKNYFLLRTFNQSAELNALDPRDPNVLCDKIVSEFGTDNDMNVWVDTSENLFMLLHVPELNLVVAGSASGRVALLRLTRPPVGKLPRASFRTEWILPRESDEKRSLRPQVNLMGVAVSPVRVPGARGLDLELAGGPGRPDAPKRRTRTPVYPRKWRLLLHYVDHTILQYTIQAEEPRAEDIF